MFETFGGHRRYYSLDEEVAPRYEKEARRSSSLVFKAAMISFDYLRATSLVSVLALGRLRGRMVSVWPLQLRYWDCGRLTAIAATGW